jgi:hypothetical protein
LDHFETANLSHWATQFIYQQSETFDTRLGRREFKRKYAVKDYDETYRVPSASDCFTPSSEPLDTTNFVLRIVENSAQAKLPRQWEV